MIELITPYLTDYNPKTIAPYRTFLKVQSNYIFDRKNTFLKAPAFTSRGLTLLSYLFNFLDMSYMDELSSNYERYINHVRFIRPIVSNSFDRVRRGRGYRRMFFDSPGFKPTEEFIYPVEDVNEIVNLPLSSERWEDWRHVQPVRIWAHDSEEFSICLLHDRVRFFKEPPSYAIILVDVVALCFKYYIWYHTQRDRETNVLDAIHAPRRLFLHKYVMTDLVFDLANIWVLKTMNKVIASGDNFDPKDFTPSNLTSNAMYGRVTGGSQQAFKFLHGLVSDSTKALIPDSLLSSKLFFMDSTFNERLRTCSKKLVLPPRREYMWMGYLRDLEDFVLYCNIWGRRATHPKFQKIFTNIRRNFKYFIMRKPWSNCLHPELRKEIERSLHVIEDWLEYTKPNAVQATKGKLPLLNLRLKLTENRESS